MSVSPLLLAIGVLCQMSASTATPGAAGRVVSAPHGGYDQYSEHVARSVANRLGWGVVTAIGYRSVPYRYWYDVNRPTERGWTSGTFGATFRTTEAGRIYDDYQRRLLRAARRTSGPLDLLVEIHGHSRSLRTNSGGTVRPQVIELATTGFTLTQLRRIKRRYRELVASVPASLRVTLAIDRLDSTYEYGGWIIPFYFRANAAKQLGSLRSSRARKALHFELPRRARSTASARSAYSRLLARLVEGL